MNFVATGIGAGLVSALLWAVVLKATPLADILYLLAPIPVLIVALGWNHRSGLVAALVGGVAIAAFISPLDGLSFALVTALPAWWLAYLALLGRQQPDGAMDWYPLGRLLVWVAATAALTLVVISFISTDGDHGRFHEAARKMAERVVGLQFPATGPNSLDEGFRKELVDVVARFVPFGLAQGYTVTFALYLWGAAKIVSISQRLPRPWHPVSELALPRGVLLLFVLAVVLAGAGSGFVGFFGYALAGALFMAFGLQCLAVIHDRTRGKPGRPLILTGLYFLTVMTQGLTLVPMSLFGLADTAFGLRRRFNAGRPKQPQPPSL